MQQCAAATEAVTGCSRRSATIPETSNPERAMANPFVHVELATTDIDQAKSFYRSLFDWKLNDMDMGGGIARRDDPARGHRGAECRLVLDHRRPDRRDAGPLAAAKEVAAQPTLIDSTGNRPPAARSHCSVL